MRIPITLAAAALAVSLAPDAHASTGGTPLEQVREATTVYHDYAVAQAEGTVPVVDLAGNSCIADPGGSGAMGTHYLFPSRLLSGGGFDSDIVRDKPEILLYDMTTPSPTLTGVEYVVTAAEWHAAHGGQPPKLFGRKFTLVKAGNRYGLPDFYELHAWIWKDNPTGMFADWNPDVSC